MKQSLLKFNLKPLLLVALLLLEGGQFSDAWAQETITFDFEDESAHRTSGSNSYTSTNTYTENGTNISLDYADAVTTGTPLSGSANVLARIAKNTTNSPTVIIGPIDNTDYTITAISFKIKNGSNSAISRTVHYSSDNKKWTSIISKASISATTKTESQDNLNITESTFYLKFTLSTASSTSSNRDIQIDDIVITREKTSAPAADPVIAYDGEIVNTAYGTPYKVDTNLIEGGDITLESSNTAVATVEGLNVTPVAVGTTTIAINTAATDTWLAGTATFTLNVTAPAGKTTAADGSVALTATLSSTTGYATFCSEYPIDYSDESEFSAWEITGTSGTTITFRQITGAVKGGTGVFLKGNKGATVSLTSADSDNQLDNNLLVGTLAPTYVAAGEYLGLSGNEFVPVKAGTVKAGKALLPAGADPSTPVKAFTFVFNGADGIQHVETVSAEDAKAIFNIAGQRMKRMLPGVNIVNGRKVLVK